MKRLTRNQIFAIIFYLITFIILLSTQPQHLPVAVLLIPLLTFFMAFLLTVRWAVFKFARSRDSRLSKKRLDILSIMIAAFPVLCVLLQSIGQFSFRDLIMLAVFFIILWFYLVRSQAAA